MKRLRKSIIAPNMSVKLKNTFCEVSQTAFLSSSYNKLKFIDLLAVQFEADHCTIGRCTGDHAVPDNACTGGIMEVNAADTNLLIILIYFWNSLMGEINIKPEAKKKLKAIERDIGNIV